MIAPGTLCYVIRVKHCLAVRTNPIAPDQMNGRIVEVVSHLRPVRTIPGGWAYRIAADWLPGDCDCHVHPGCLIPIAAPAPDPATQPEAQEA